MVANSKSHLTILQNISEFRMKETLHSLKMLLHQRCITTAELSRCIFKFGVKYKNLVNTRDLTPIAFTFWQVMVTNIHPQRGHLNDVSNFGVYLLWMFAI